MRATARRASCKSRAMRAAASSAAVSRESPHSSSAAWRLSGISAARRACIRVAPHGSNSREVRGIGGGGGQSSSHRAGACGERVQEVDVGGNCVEMLFESGFDGGPRILEFFVLGHT